MNIAITGTIASGKSLCSNILRRMGYSVFDSDNYAKISYHKNHPAYNEIVHLFKDYNILDKNNEIIIKNISNIIFNDKLKKKQLEDIIHPYVVKGILNAQSKSKGIFFAEVPLLFESNMEGLFDYIWLITCDKDIAIKRCMDERGYTYKESIKRYNSQFDNKLKIEKADYVLYNNGTIKELYNQILKWLEENYVKYR